MTLADLRDTLVETCDKHDQVLLLIEACLSSDIDSRGTIIRTLVDLGYDRGHVALILNRNTGTSKSSSRWARGENGRYSLLD